MRHAKRPLRPFTLLLALVALALLPSCATPTGMPEPLRNRRDVTVTAWSWGFEPPILQVTQGQRIRMTLSSLDVAHSLVNHSLGLNIAIPPRGEPAAIHEFTAPTFGEYVFHSETASGPGVSQMQMRLIVMR